MKRFRVLVLTDHSVHTRENSLYSIVRALCAHDRIIRIDIASRGLKSNDCFFENPASKDLEVISATGNFAFDSTGIQFSESSYRSNLLDYDIIMLRLPRPLSDIFLRLLSEVCTGKLVINNPLGIIESSNKKFLLNFPELCPPIKICRSIEDIFSFSKDFAIVLKPLEGYGGKGVLKFEGAIVNDGKTNYYGKSYFKYIQNTIESKGYLGMKYLKNVDLGDKRLIVVNGKILGASLRIPVKNNWICNVSSGGSTEFSEADQDEKNIVDVINPVLIKMGILIYGIDTLLDDSGKRVLSEINTLSPGGFPQAELQSGQPIIQLTIEQILNNADRYFN